MVGLVAAVLYTVINVLKDRRRRRCRVQECDSADHALVQRSSSDDDGNHFEPCEGPLHHDDTNRPLLFVRV